MENPSRFIRPDQNREQDRMYYRQRMLELRKDPVAYAQFKAQKAAYMKLYRQKRKSKREAVQVSPEGT